MTATVGPARGELTELRLESVEPFADGQAFGDAGPYERIKGVARGEVDPADPRNSGIALLDHAPRNERGRVEYELDFFALRPQRGSNKLLYDVTNRGAKVSLGFFSSAAQGEVANDPRSAAHAGDGFLLRRGYTLVWSGWDETVPRESDLMTARFPVASKDGEPLRGQVRDEFVFGVTPPEVPPSARLSYPAADRAGARLTVRQRERDTPREIPTSDWFWLDDRHVALRDDSFEPGAIYDFRYLAKDPPVLGLGFAAVRDLVSFLRRETRDAAGNPNPIAGASEGTGIDVALAVGVSQSGRFLRHFLELGMNRDARDRPVFDGMLMYVSGAGKVFANHAFGQPGRTASQHTSRLFPESWFPFAHAHLSDPLTGGSGGLLGGDGFDPRIIEANSSSEYWDKGASLVHTDPIGYRDLEIPEGVRLFLISGMAHTGGLVQFAGPCAYPPNPHRPGPALRALLVALDAWVSEGREPPESRIPRIADGTLVAFEKLAFPRLPGGVRPPAPNGIRIAGDWVDPAPEDGPTYGALVPAVDSDGNEVAGLRLPDLAAPRGTHTGWNAFRVPLFQGDACGRAGGYLPFARTGSDREQTGDPRPALRERYATHEDYVARVREAVDALERARLLLPEDGRLYLERASAASDLWNP